ncbi:MAG: SCP2 sterol-binding domain-containing protein [Gammaproteobacteria bacterium]|nr:SCP2 sterol-binding domain-containing protein [Gammaproteobacteria bacterium]
MSVLGGLFEAAINRALHLDPEATRRFGELHGKAILLEIADEHTPLRLYVLPTASGVGLQREYDRTPDVTISGTREIFMKQLLRGPTVSGELTIRGDIELGQRFQRIVSSLDPDWEEGLARVIGDIPAHQLGRFARGFRQWGVRAAQTLGVDAAEYLQEEAFVLAKRERVQAFLRDVDNLRADTDRLEKRVQRLIGTA